MKVELKYLNSSTFKKGVSSYI